MADRADRAAAISPRVAPVKANSANWTAVRLLAKPEEYGSLEWAQHYLDHPDVLTQMLGDLYRVYRSEDDKRRGIANPAGGRRKSHINGNLDELWSIMTPRFSVLTFPQAFTELRGPRGLRQFAIRSGIDHRQLSRCAKEPKYLTRQILEAIAKAGDVHPAYFLEWRIMILEDLVAVALEAQPNLSITLLKQLHP
jgi:hypothetical protein